MKALLYEQLSPLIADLLRERGFDVVAVAARPDPVGRSDRAILEVASNENGQWSPITSKNFRPLAAERLARGLTHPGLILLPSSRTRTRAAVGVLADRIEAVLRERPDGLTSSERWIGPLTGT